MWIGLVTDVFAAHIRNYNTKLAGDCRKWAYHIVIALGYGLLRFCFVYDESLSKVSA
jgi:hypothetical protein